MTFVPPPVPPIVIQDLLREASMGMLCEEKRPCIGFSDAEGREWWCWLEPPSVIMCKDEFGGFLKVTL